MKPIRNFLIVVGALIALTAMAAVTYVGNLTGNTVTATNLTAYTSSSLKGLWASSSDAVLLARETNQASGKIYLTPYRLVGNVLVGDGGGFTNVTIAGGMFTTVGGDPTITNGNTTLSVLDAVSMFNVQNVGGGNFTLLSAGGMVWTGAATGNGSGITNISSTSIMTPVKAGFYTNYTATTADAVLMCTGTNQIITLPLAPPVGTMFTTISASLYGSVIVTNGDGAQTISGGLYQNVSATNRLTVIFDGSNYW